MEQGQFSEKREFLRWRLWLLLVLLTVCATSCSHTSPYFREKPARVEPGKVSPRGDEPSHEIDHRLLLIGDTGSPDADGQGQPVLEALLARAAALSERATIVFLGDLIYEAGLPTPDDPDLEDALRRIAPQVDILARSGARGIFLPGNHDWDRSGERGWARIRALSRYLEQQQARDGVRVELLPAGGCPGPRSVRLGSTVDLIVLDTQWWLHRHQKPRPGDNPTGCANTRESEVESALEGLLERAARNGRRAVVAAHHPLASRGPHAGFASATTHLFPLTELHGYIPFVLEWIPVPVLGTIAAWGRACCSPSDQDFSAEANQRMRGALERAMKAAAALGAAPLVYAAGHDHSLQVFEGDGTVGYMLVSGLGSPGKGTRVTSSERTLFAHSRRGLTGFMQIDFLKDEGVRLSVIEADARDGQVEGIWSVMLAPAR